MGRRLPIPILLFLGRETVPADDDHGNAGSDQRGAHPKVNQAKAGISVRGYEQDGAYWEGEDPEAEHHRAASNQTWAPAGAAPGSRHVQSIRVFGSGAW